MDKAERYQCYVPYGFITTLEPKSAKEDFDQILTTASRVSIAEAYAFSATPEPDVNVAIQLQPQTCLHRLNREFIPIKHGVVSAQHRGAYRSLSESRGPTSRFGRTGFGWIVK
jgi:hypothetical protein